MNRWFSILLMICTIYAIRSVPMIVLRKNITNRWLRSFLYYVPYVTLAVMTFPAIISATGRPSQGIAALAAGLVLSWVNGDLFIVAVCCCAAAFLSGLVF